MELIFLSGEYDYYAFADQDDVWMPQKLRKAIEKLSRENDKTYALYCSNCTVTDENLNEIRLLHNNKNNILPENKIHALVQGFAHGCTMVFNNNARNLILKYKPYQEYAHDFWIPIILVFLGKVIYDEDSYILYRQHKNNCFGAKNSILKMIKLKSTLFNNKRDFYSNMIMEILEGYGDMLDKDDKLMLENILSYRNSLVNKTKFLFNRQLKRNTIRGSLFIKFLILFSRF